MPTTTDYTGNPSGTQSPSATPDVNVLPILRLPTGTATRTIESIYQAFKVLADFISYIQLATVRRALVLGDAALYAFQDYGGNNRATIDHNGFMAGRISRVSLPAELLDSSSNTSNAVNYFGGWSIIATTTDCQVTLGGDATSTTTTNEGVGTILTTAASGAIGGIYLSTRFYFVQAYSSIFVDFEVFVFGGSTNNDLRVGLTKGGASWSTTTSSVMLAREAGDTNWSLITGDGTTITKTSCGISPSGTQRIRLELHGASTPRGVSNGGTVARCFINGSLVATSTTHVPLAHDGLTFAHLTKATASTATVGFALIAMEASWNRFLDCPAV